MINEKLLSYLRSCLNSEIKASKNFCLRPIPKILSLKGKTSLFATVESKGKKLYQLDHTSLCFLRVCLCVSKTIFHSLKSTLISHFLSNPFLGKNSGRKKIFETFKPVSWHWHATLKIISEIKEILNQYFASYSDLTTRISKA